MGAAKHMVEYALKIEHDYSFAKSFFICYAIPIKSYKLAVCKKKNF